MVAPLVKGSFLLNPGTRLILTEMDGIVFSEKPLRALRVNNAAFKVLDRCRTGITLEECGRLFNTTRTERLLAMLDRLCAAGLVSWIPSENEPEPFVSIVIPVYSRALDLRACLESLAALDYPTSRLEIIVVDDGSTDDTRDVACKFDVKLISLGSNRGQSAARNVGVSAAAGEITAFIDSDCTADRSWLRDLVPFFQDSRTALVGGYVASFYEQSLLDRYEEAKSPLNMGEDLLVGSGSETDFYVPTCNMLVRTDAYLKAGGLNEVFRVGEDVDLCWRLKERGHRLVYVPKGHVKHKHRNRLFATFKRRFDYGTSEPALHTAHPQVAKRYPWQPACMAAGLISLFALFLGRPELLSAAALVIFGDSIGKWVRYERQVKESMRFRSVLRATVEKHVQLLYYLSFHVIRYYLVPLLVISSLWTPLISVVAGLVLFPAFVESHRKSPRLSFPFFLFFFVVEQVSYQAGVFWGCVKQRTFRSYRIKTAQPRLRPTREASA